MNIVLSIKPEFISEIQTGRKRFEFRKTIYKQPVEKVYIYASAPVSKIVGEFQPLCLLKGLPEDIWLKTREYAGINKEWFDRYYEGKNIAYAIGIKNLLIYAIPRSLPFHAPQSFCYVDRV